MGASDSKLVFKQGIFKLSEQKHIAADDEYWTGVRNLRSQADELLTAYSSGSFPNPPKTSLRSFPPSTSGELETMH